jgi:hypothetical protein
MYSRSRGTYWEPLLPVPTIITTTCSDNGGEYDNELNGRKMNERYRHETHQLLRGEIEFQFRRVFKKVVGTKKGGTVPTLFLQLGGVDDRKAKSQRRRRKGLPTRIMTTLTISQIQTTSRSMRTTMTRRRNTSYEQSLHPNHSKR